MADPDYDVIVIGSGFGGGVAALRLAEKGYSVLVLEAGRRFGPEDFARSTWNLRRFLWFPRLGMRGIQRIDLLRQVMVLSGAGVGGGSLVYANTLIEPEPDFFRDPQWADIADWRTELEPWYDQARRMLGVVGANATTPSDSVMAALAEHFGVRDHQPVQIGVFRGEAGVRVPDPLFGGLGPDCRGCIECGGCMVGCRHEAKNTVDRTYLHLAERAGVQVLAEHEVVDLEPVDPGWRVSTRRPGGWVRHRPRSFAARHVVFAAGGLGTTRLLLRLRAAGRVPAMSDRIGHLVRTNSEAIVGAVSRRRGRVDYSKGVAITSSFHPEPGTRIETVRYPAGSNSMGLLGTILVPGGKRWQPVRYLWHAVRSPVQWLRSLSVRRWSERGVVVLVMQSADNSIRLEWGRGVFGHRLRSRPGHGVPNPRWLPVAHEAARAAAVAVGGDPAGSINESLLGIPLTAHLIGGATIGSSPERGVVDPYHRMYGHPSLSVVCGAAVPANLGANPSLTIAAMAERAIAAWPNNGEPDPRPAMGEPYRPVRVAPHRPVVPAGAPGALRS